MSDKYYIAAIDDISSLIKEDDHLLLRDPRLAFQSRLKLFPSIFPRPKEVRTQRDGPMSRWFHVAQNAASISFLPGILYMQVVSSDRMSFVQELQSVVGKSVPVKTVVFLEQMMNKKGSRECQLADLVTEALPICDELHHSVDSADWEPQFIYYCKRSKLDDIRLARHINGLYDTLTGVIDGRWAFI
nr:hypothetical protein [Tanacetum cinerariifolium]